MEPTTPITKLIAQRPRTYVAIAVLGTLTIAVLDLLYWASLSWAASTRDGSVAAFDLDAEGTIASWFSSALLFVAGQAALLVWHLKNAEVRALGVDSQPPAPCEVAQPPPERRLDGIPESIGLHLSGPVEHAASPRAWVGPGLWLCAAGVWFLMSLDETASLHEGWKELAARVLGTRVHGDGSILWAAPYFAVLSVLGCLILYEARGSLPTAALLVLAGGFYGLAVAAQTGLILKDLGGREVMFEESAEMLGDLSILLCMLTYARHINYERQARDTQVVGPYALVKAIDFAHRRGLAFRGE